MFFLWILQAFYLKITQIKKNTIPLIFFASPTSTIKFGLLFLAIIINKKSFFQKILKKKTLYISIKTIASIIKEAEKQGYIKRQKSSSDTRIKYIQPTDKTTNEFEVWSKNLKCNLNKMVK